MKQVPITVWYGCYDRQWSGVLSPDSYRHPAKFARGLVERILDYGIAKSYWQPGQRLGDPFGGIGGGAIPAADRGFEWIGSELESQFVTIANGMDCPGLTKAEWVRWFGRYERNKALCPSCQARAGKIYDREYSQGKIPEVVPHRYAGNLEPRRNWKLSPKLVQGDSRRFADVVRSVAGCVTSPPFATSTTKPSKLGSGKATRKDGDGAGRNKGDYIYAESEGQIGGLDAAVTSPPFVTGRGGAQGIAINGVATERRSDQRMRDRSYLGPDAERDEANIEKLQPGAVLDAAVTSLPHGNAIRGQRDGVDWDKAKRKGPGGGEHQKPGQSLHATYGDTEGQIGELTGGEVDAVCETCLACAKRLQTGRWQTVKIVELESVAEAVGVSSTIVSISGAKADPKQRSTKRKSQQLISESQVNASEKRIRTGTADQAAGEATLGESVGGPLLSETATNAVAARANTTSSSTIKKTSPKPEANGTTVSTILKRFAEAVTRASTPDDQRSVAIPLCAKCAGKLTSRKSIVTVAAVTAIAERLLTRLNTTAGRIGRASGETYWEACAKVYASCFEAIKPGGVMALVVKDYCRDRKRVRLCDDTMRLLEHLGFEPVERIHAMVTETTEHADLFEGTVTKKKERKSFFRRLQESKGAPPIDYEEVLIVRKPI